jgi:hypothetical protein
MAAILDVDYAQQSPDSGIRVRPTMWQSGTAIHCHHISYIPHQQFHCTMTTCHLYFDPRSIFQVCRHVKANSHTTSHAHAAPTPCVNSHTTPSPCPAPIMPRPSWKSTW